MLNKKKEYFAKGTDSLHFRTDFSFDINSFFFILKQMTDVHENDIKDSFWHFCSVFSFITLVVIEYAMLFY